MTVVLALSIVVSFVSIPLGLLLESKLQRARWQTRWIWMCSIALSFATTLAGYIQFAKAGIPLTPIDGLVVLNLLGCSVISFAWMLLTRRPSATVLRAETVENKRLEVCRRVLPGIVGFFKPVILLPAEIDAAPATIKGPIILHELQHLKAYDEWTGLAASAARVILAWNPAIYWQTARLRFCTEVDCDLRVIRSGRVRLGEYVAVLRWIESRYVKQVDIDELRRRIALLRAAWGHRARRFHSEARAGSTSPDTPKSVRQVLETSAAR